MTELPAHLVAYDDAFLTLVHPISRLIQIATGFTWTEGSVWFGDHNCLMFSDIPSQRLIRCDQKTALRYCAKTRILTMGTRVIAKAVLLVVGMAPAMLSALNMMERSPCLRTGSPEST